MMRTVYLHGHLKEKFGASFELDVATAGEALRALHVNFPTFTATLKDGSYEIVRGEFDERGMALDIEDLNDFRLGKADLHIAPYVAGSKEKGGFLKVLLGILIVGAAIFLSGGSLAAPLGAGLIGGAVTWGNVAMVGVAMIFAGVSKILAPTEEAATKDESYTISGPGNTYQQGSPIPIIYGECIVGSVMISAGLDIEDVAIGGAGSGSADRVRNR